LRHTKPAAIFALAAAASAAVALPSPAADGDTPPPPRSVSPVVGKTITAGKQFTFQVRSRGNSAVFVVVSKSKRKAADGTLRDKKGYMRKMGRRKGTLFTKKVELYRGLDSHFLNKPGTYYWQAHRINCSEQKDCAVEGPIRRFRVR
jgi:hypothetical protein